MEPEKATFLFVGLDANYEEALESSPVFDRVLEYHQDGVAFWHRHGVHHPFLLSQYKGDGRRYHRNFARIGFLPKHAALVSFVELLHVPTIGRNRLKPGDLDERHLRRVNAAISAGAARHVFVSSGVARLMRATDTFAWLPSAALRGSVLPVLHQCAGTTIYMHLHLSNYGKFQQQLDREAAAIALLLP